MRSSGAIRTFWFFTMVSIAVDLLWLFVYSPLRPIAWDTMLALSRKDQVRVAHSHCSHRPPWLEAPGTALLSLSHLALLCMSTYVVRAPTRSSR